MFGVFCFLCVVFVVLLAFVVFVVLCLLLFKLKLGRSGKHALDRFEAKCLASEKTQHIITKQARLF